MRVILKEGLIVLVPETAEESAAAASWKTRHAGQVFLFDALAGEGVRATSLGPKDEACREPLNVVSTAGPEVAPISNLAPAPFVLDGAPYASVEGFWQSLKYTSAEERRRVAALSGTQAKRAGEGGDVDGEFEYLGRRIRVGTADHWDLMERACRAKFDQCAAAREALMATGNRPLEHRVRKDSRTIPGVVMAKIWVRIRTDLHARSR